eukprot:UN00591
MLEVRCDEKDLAKIFQQYQEKPKEWSNKKEYIHNQKITNKERLHWWLHLLSFKEVRQFAIRYRRILPDFEKAWKRP